MKQLIYAAGLLFLAACGNGNAQHTGGADAPATDANTVTLTDAQLRNADVRTALPPVRTGANTISVKGQVEAPPRNRISVTSPLGGYVKDIRLHIGDRVTKGQTLVTLEDMQYIQLQQDYLAGKVRLAQAQSEYERQEALSRTQASSAKQAETARADYENLRVTQRATGEKLRLLGIDPDALTPDNLRGTLPLRSPVNGYVTAVNANLGKYATGTDVLMELVDPTDIHLSLRVFEKDLPHLHIGQKVTAYTNTDPQKKYGAEIVLIGKTVMPDKSVEVHCHFHKIPPELIPGLYMNADIETVGTAAPTLPQDAVITDNGAPFVFLQTAPNRFSLVPVTVQWTQNDSTGISWKTPPPEGTRVVTRNAYALYMQMKNG